MKTNAARILDGLSAGHRGVQLVLPPTDYLRATQGKLGPISKPKSG